MQVRTLDNGRKKRRDLVQDFVALPQNSVGADTFPGAKRPDGEAQAAPTAGRGARLRRRLDALPASFACVAQHSRSLRSKDAPKDRTYAFPSSSTTTVQRRTARRSAPLPRLIASRHTNATHKTTNDNPAYPTSARLTRYQLALLGAQSAGNETLSMPPADGLQKRTAATTAGATIQTSVLNVSSRSDQRKNSVATENASTRST